MSDLGLGVETGKGSWRGGGVSICAVYLITHDLLHVPKGGGGGHQREMQNPEESVQPPPPPQVTEGAMTLYYEYGIGSHTHTLVTLFLMS